MKFAKLRIKKSIVKSFVFIFAATKVSSTMTVTAAMSDEEIRENLLKLGQNVGPVVDSTRAFYRRKLARLLGEIKDEPQNNTSGNEGNSYCLQLVLFTHSRVF